MVLCAGDHTFSDDSIVSFSEVQGMTELNSIGPVKIKNLSESELVFVVFVHFSDCAGTHPSCHPQ